MDGLRRLTATVRFRVTVLAAAMVLVVLAAAGAGLVITQDRLLTRNVDNGLRQRADDLAALAASGPLPSRLGGVDDDTAAQVVSARGEVLGASANLALSAPPLAAPPDADDESLRTLGGVPVDDGRFRLISRRVNRAAGPVVVHVATSLDDVRESTATLRTSVLVAVPAVTALLALLVWWLVGRTLRPVEAIRAEVAAIGGSGLHRRVPVPPGDDEITRLARTMNGMLDRVEDAAQRQQRFVADASHELRSPLTRIRSEIEVDLAHPASGDLAATHRSVLEETGKLQRLVDDLLALARSDAVRSVAADKVVDLDDLVLQHARRVRTGARVAVESSGVTAAQVRGDGGELERAVANLVDNAVRHAARTVTLTLAEQGGLAVLGVTDDGPGVPPADHERVFERFTRLDDARTGAGGAGLGLAIAREIARRHGGDVSIDAGYEPGARFVLTVPTVADGERPAS